jgi:hypothetical protein
MPQLETSVSLKQTETLGNSQCKDYHLDRPRDNALRMGEGNWDSEVEESKSV